LQVQNKSGNRKQRTGAGPGEMWKHFISPAIFDKPGIFPGSAWTEHIPFAFWLIESLKPNLFVELGTHYGLSYFTFCQAIQKARLKTTCYAVDNWMGDEHAGFYDGTVFDFVKTINEAYSSFSTLKHLTFDEAISFFDDQSIDLLHIDGLHTYEAVKHDFETWLPKISAKGIVLFHDTHVTERGFGVHKLWEELIQHYPSFEFTHGFGLGILGVGKNIPGKLAKLFKTASAPEIQTAIQRAYERLGYLCRTEQEHIRTCVENSKKEIVSFAPGNNIEPVADAGLKPEKSLSALQQISMQVFWQKENEIFNEADSVNKIAELATDAIEYAFELNQPFSMLEKIRIDPSARPGVFYLHSINITSAGGHTLQDWESIKNESCFYNLVILKSMLVENVYVLVAITEDPIIEIKLSKMNIAVQDDTIQIRIAASKLTDELMQQELSCISIAGLKTQ
jgi:hypothetical protein